LIINGEGKIQKDREYFDLAYFQSQIAAMNVRHLPLRRVGHNERKLECVTVAHS